MPSFQDSVDLGYRYLETDVHLSADGVLFAFHDHNLRARTGVDTTIADLEAAEIDALLVDGVAPIPRLDDIFLTWPNARLNIDAKSDATVMPLIASIRAHRAIDRVCIGSFVDRRIKKCRQELGSELCTSMGKFEAARLWLASRGLADTTQIVAACAQVPIRIRVNVATPALVDLAHSLNIQVHVWTVDEPDQMRALLDWGVDGIMTDQPRILRDVLINRGVWAPEGVLQ
jgi:glycerophosphoryl diester phosphodiesterase